MGIAREASTLVLLPAYNAEAYLARSIESVLAQTCGDWEMIIIDDASTDGTGELARQYAREDSRLTVITNETNRFICYSRNRAAAMTGHEYLMMQDADDVSLPERLALSLQFMASRPQVTMVGGNYILTDPEGDDCYPIWRHPQDSDDVRDLLWAGTYLPLHPTWLVRRRAFEAIGGYDEFFQGCEDHDFLVRMSLVGPIGFLRDPLIRYRAHGGNLSFQRRLRRRVEREVAFERAEALREGRPYDLPAEFDRHLALREQEKHREECPEYEAAYTTGKLYLTTGKKRQARRQLVRAVRACPGRAGGYLGLLLSLLPAPTLHRLLHRRQERREPPTGEPRA